MKYALIGNPNSGKTTVFNLLTGSNQKVGNWSGVTVDKKTGVCVIENEQVEIIDLPGIYSLNASSKNAYDEYISCNYLINETPDVIINIIDASNLERNLYLTMQLLELNIPIIFVLNMVDIANKKNIIIFFDKLEKILGAKVIPVIAKNKNGLDNLKKQLFEKNNISTFDIKNCYNLENLKTALIDFNLFTITGYLEKNLNVLNNLEKNKTEQLDKFFLETENNINDIVQQRYKAINEIIKKTCDLKNKKNHKVTELIDSICMNRYLGIPVFLFVMYLMFQFSITIGGALQPLFDDSSRAIFIDGIASASIYLGFPMLITGLLSQGIGLGINTVLTFIPQIGCMFLFLAVLEDSGYMSRAAFVMDRAMQTIGLPGKSFVPLIVGFGCNVPSIMATRTLETRRDRLLTIMMAPFMSCGAKLAIFAVFASAFFPSNGGIIVFILYLTGIAMAILTGLAIKHTFLKSENNYFIMEMPIYHAPKIGSILSNAWLNLKRFLTRASKYIIPICIVLGTLNSIKINGEISTNPDGSRQSILSASGKIITPIFSPMGITNENWPATVGLLTGVLAKEVVIGTLNVLYSENDNSYESLAKQNEKFKILPALKASWDNTIESFSNISISSFINPFTANEADTNMNNTAMGNMTMMFSSLFAVFAYLLFILLYIPCVSTIGVMVREAGAGWAWLSIIWSTSLAYCSAVVFYQFGNILSNPASALIIIFLAILYMAILIFGMKKVADKIKFKILLSGCKGCT